MHRAQHLFPPFLQPTFFKHSRLRHFTSAAEPVQRADMSGQRDGHPGPRRRGAGEGRGAE